LSTFAQMIGSDERYCARVRRDGRSTRNRDT
jgi:hypothetical protein